ncbi:MAG: hypothetical protein OCD01_13995 [Fibrobacterales bacterium]
MKMVKKMMIAMVLIGSVFAGNAFAIGWTDNVEIQKVGYHAGGGAGYYVEVHDTDNKYYLFHYNPASQESISEAGGLYSALLTAASLQKEVAIFVTDDASHTFNAVSVIFKK